MIRFLACNFNKFLPFLVIFQQQT